MAIIKWLIEQIKLEVGIECESTRCQAILKKEACLAKVALSSEHAVSIIIDIVAICDDGDENLPMADDDDTEFTVELDRATFEEICEPVW